MEAGNHSGKMFVLILGLVLLAGIGGGERYRLTAARGVVLAPSGGLGEGASLVSQTGRPFEQTLGQSAEALLKGTRRWLRRIFRTVSRSTETWGAWLGRALLFVPVVLVALLVDRGLVAAWRRDGLRVLANYVPLMLYVHARLVLTPKVSVSRKLLLAGAMVYGVYRRDLVPDRAALAGLADDVLVIVVAARVFLAGCSEQLVRVYARRAVRWRQRFLELQRARQR